MDVINGTVRDNENNIIAENIPIWIELGGTQYVKTWSGYFELDQESSIRAMIGDQRPCSLELEDGRRGAFHFVGGSGSTVRFKGNGPLE